MLPRNDSSRIPSLLIDWRASSASMPVLLKKWQPSSLYGSDALRRAIRLYQAMGDAARTEKSPTGDEREHARSAVTDLL